MDIFSVIFSPAETMLKVKERPRWQLPFTILCVLVIIHAWLQDPILQQLMQYGAEVTSKQEEQLQVFNAVFKYLMIIVAPIILLITLFLSSGFIYLAIIFSTSEAKFRDIFSAITVIHIIKIIEQYISVMIVYIKGINTVTSQLDLPSFGFNVFFNMETIGKLPYIILSKITIFEVWYITLLTISISILFNFSKLKSTTISVTFWLFSSTIAIIMDMLSH